MAEPTGGGGIVHRTLRRHLLTDHGLLGWGEKRHIASGENNHFASDENRQSQSDEKHKLQ